MKKGRVFSIGEFSVHDGPGVRMTVFLKGCLLRCNWCHSPEGQSYEREVMKNAHGCVGCLKCLDAGVEESGVRKLTERSIAVCPHRLLRMCGTDYTPQELVALIEKKRQFLVDGGVTFSGGEPLFQAEFLQACLELLEGRVHRALQTSGYAENKTFQRILPHVDYVLYDLKLMDEEQSRAYLGADNRLILENFRLLAASGVPYVVRIPLIPTVTDTEENLRKIAQFMEENGAKRAEMMPYHKLSGSKYALTGRQYAPKFQEDLAVQPRTALFEARGIEVKVL